MPEQSNRRKKSNDRDLQKGIEREIIKRRGVEEGRLTEKTYERSRCRKTRKDKCKTQNYEWRYVIKMRERTQKGEVLRGNAKTQRGYPTLRSTA